MKRGKFLGALWFAASVDFPAVQMIFFFEGELESPATVRFWALDKPNYMVNQH
jgi:hypothetical protein